MYMAALGGTGMRELARLNYYKCEYLKGELREAGFNLPFSQTTFNEFVVRLPGGAVDVYDRLIKQKIIAGLPLECHFSELKDHYLLCATETHSKDDLDGLVEALKESFSGKI